MSTTGRTRRGGGSLSRTKQPKDQTGNFIYSVQQMPIERGIGPTPPHSAGPQGPSEEVRRGEERFPNNPGSSSLERGLPPHCGKGSGTAWRTLHSGDQIIPSEEEAGTTSPPAAPVPTGTPASLVDVQVRSAISPVGPGSPSPVLSPTDAAAGRGHRLKPFTVDASTCHCPPSLSAIQQGLAR